MVNPFPAPRHDAGGKSKWPLLPGVRGGAEFAGQGDVHRLLLWRDWGPEFPALDALPDFNGAALWIGMNPSTAEADIDDLTVRKEQVWTRMLRLTRYLKMNVSTYRSTDPRALAGAAANGMTRHPDNLPMLRRCAERASVIIVATGLVPDCIRQDALAVFDTLRDPSLASKVRCLGLTKAGWPKHSSRIGYDVPIQPWDARL